MPPSPQARGAPAIPPDPAAHGTAAGTPRSPPLPSPPPSPVHAAAPDAPTPTGALLAMPCKKEAAMEEEEEEWEVVEEKTGEVVVGMVMWGMERASAASRAGAVAQ